MPVFHTIRSDQSCSCILSLQCAISAVWIIYITAVFQVTHDAHEAGGSQCHLIRGAEREFSNHGFVLILVMFSNTPTINLSKAYQSLDQRQSHKLAIACFSSEAHSDTISFISYQLTKGILETTFRSRNEAAFCSISAFA